MHFSRLLRIDMEKPRGIEMRTNFVKKLGFGYEEKKINTAFQCDINRMEKQLLAPK